MEITKINTKDVIALQYISHKTFTETFAVHNTVENMKQYLDQYFTVDNLTVEIENPNSQFYFAKQDNRVMGYLKLNFAPAQTELQDGSSIEIERIYVLKENHGSGVGIELLNFAIEIAKQNKAAYIWLGVWENNHRAIRFYKNNGFTTFDKHQFVLGSEEQTDLMMRLEIG
ncbi:MAG: GNAT family N-acetyltransferase [Saprospiraceae bacterium]|nr:GNAT family N-acetyltransferase [Saprospiraceae bacterium]